MDIFNRKRVAELEAKLRDTERERDKYISKVAELAVKLDVISKLEDSKPEDCTKGPWCKACEFAKTIHYNPSGINHWTNQDAYYGCSKGESCKHFVQKEDA